MRRTGSYAIGQVAVATINAFCSWIMMMIVGIPYAAVLAVLVGFLGLVPMVGAAARRPRSCALVAVFDEPQKAVIALIYYIVYQQIENYVVAPRVMQRTVSVPGAVTVVAALAGGTLLGRARRPARDPRRRRAAAALRRGPAPPPAPALGRPVAGPQRGGQARP